MSEFKLIVAGGRDFTNYPKLVEELYSLSSNELKDYEISIVSGMARGADNLGVQFAKEYGVQLYKFPANWNEHGRAAGHIRNREMGDFADGLLAFWDGKSRGTKGMIDYTKKLNKPFKIVRY